jgi:hypothetical protein
VFPRRVVWLTTFLLALVLVVGKWALAQTPSEIFRTSLGADWLATAIIVLFGAMLGTDRRWWPWSLAPVAALLSLGPAMAVLAIPSRFTVWTWFGGTFALFIAGLVASSWRPLSEWLAHRVGGSVERPAAAERPARRVRPAVVANALGAAVLLVSFLAARFDPVGTQISTTLPTYLGARILAEDVRAQHNLVDALAALEAHRADAGTYVGFDATDGAAAVPELAWADRASHEQLVVAIETARVDLARVVVRSGSGAVYCGAVTPSGTTSGRADREGDGIKAQVARAVAACDAEPLSAAAIPTIDVAGLCTLADPDGIPLCRSVQELLARTLATPIPQS